MGAWTGWYHVDGHTYGTWLPGDPRGWREKHHRKHVPGDYRDPPPKGFGDDVLNRSRDSLKHPPVHFTPPQREVVGRAIVEMLAWQGLEVIAASVDAVHYHILAKFPDTQVRPRVGRAKKHAWFKLREQGETRKVWEHLCNVTPIADSAHQVRVYNYILEHAEKGAWTWNYTQGLYWVQDRDEPGSALK